MKNPTVSAELEGAVPLVRRLTLEDVDRVMEIELSAYPHPWTRGIFQDCIRVGYECWGLQLAERLAAYTIISHAAGESHLLNLCVAPDLQGQGLGRLLLGHAFRQARQAGCSHMFLEVRPSNTAGINLYLKNGFTVVGERPGYYRTDEGHEDAIIMRCDLDRESGADTPGAGPGPFTAGR